MQNLRLEPTGLTNPGRTTGLMGTGLGLARQQGVGQVFRLVWKQTYLFLWSQPGQLAGNPDLLLTLSNRNNMNSKLIDITNCKTCILRVLDCWITDFDTILLSNSKNKSTIWIYSWICWATSWQPTQCTQVERFQLNRTQIDGSGQLTTWTANLATFRFQPTPRPKATVQNYC
jgi:hypothetical protein